MLPLSTWLKKDERERCIDNIIRNMDTWVPNSVISSDTVFPLPSSSSSDDIKSAIVNGLINLGSKGPEPNAPSYLQEWMMNGQHHCMSIAFHQTLNAIEE